VGKRAIGRRCLGGKGRVSLKPKEEKKGSRTEVSDGVGRERGLAEEKGNQLKKKPSPKGN